MTPLYGGGVRAGEVDRELPIRPSSIRGQLRFWWRIACGGDDSAESLFKREAAIWGGIAEAGPTATQVRVRVRGVGPLDLEPAHRYLPDPAAPGKFKSFPALAAWAEGYALFSAKGELTKDRQAIKDPPKVLAKPGTEFELGVQLSRALSDHQREEVATALRWWASFGGLGARTRRGLGVIWVEGIDPVGVAEVTQRRGQFALPKPVSGATEAWKVAVGLLKDFRQRPGLGRNPGATPQRPGRSLWPEADSIRALSRAADPRHSKRVVSVDGSPQPPAAFLSSFTLRTRGPATRATTCWSPRTSRTTTSATAWPVPWSSAPIGTGASGSPLPCCCQAGKNNRGWRSSSRASATPLRRPTRQDAGP